MTRRLFAILGSLLFLLGGCAAQAGTAGQERTLTIYRLAEERSGQEDLAEPETYVLPEDAQAGVGQAVELFAGPSGSDGLRCALPAGVTVEDWSLDRGVVTLILSDGFLERLALDQSAAALCAVLTLCPMEDVQTVTLEAGGQTLFSGLTAEDFLLRDVPAGPEEAETPDILEN